VLTPEEVGTKVERKISIARPSAEVFSYVADVRNDPLWHTDVLDVRSSTDAVGMGTVFDVKVKPSMEPLSRVRFRMQLDAAIAHLGLLEAEQGSRDREAQFGSQGDEGSEEHDRRSKDDEVAVEELPLGRPLRLVLQGPEAMEAQARRDHESADLRVIWCRPVTPGHVLDVCNAFASKASRQR
jgi:hypothetical protein